MRQLLRFEIGNAQFLLHLTTEGLLNALAQIYMTANGSVPLIWLNIFPSGSFLKVQLALGIKDMKMHNGVQQHTAIMTLTTGGG